MTQEKIDKIIELARRGIDGEMANARRILTNMGISWEKPSKPLFESLKETFGVNTIKQYKVDVKYFGDGFLLQALCPKMIKNYNKNDFVNYGAYIHIKCTPSEINAITQLFGETREEFSKQLNTISAKIINPLF